MFKEVIATKKLADSNLRFNPRGRGMEEHPKIF
jgi:hypothetical protein